MPKLPILTGRVIPLYREVAVGTLRSVLRQANVTPDEFLAVLTSKVGKKK